MKNVRTRFSANYLHKQCRRWILPFTSLLMKLWKSVSSLTKWIWVLCFCQCRSPCSKCIEEADFFSLLVRFWFRNSILQYNSICVKLDETRERVLPNKTRGALSQDFDFHLKLCGFAHYSRAWVYELIYN